MAAPAKNINGQYVIDRVTYPVSNAVSDWYYAAATGDAATFVGVVDNVSPPTQAAIDAEVKSARDKVYGGHWGVLPANSL